MAITPQKGDITPLRHSETAQNRILIGLRWDPNTEAVHTNKLVRAVRSNVMDKNDNTFDLDLACVIYDEHDDAIDGVSGTASETMDQSGHVYHSGDDMSGTGDHDDESISVELKGFPEAARHIIFVVECQSGHTFAEINNPEVRIADGKTDEDQINIQLGQDEGGDKTAFAFVRLFRKNAGNDWLVHYIGQYYDGAQVEDWIDTLATHIG